MGLGGITPDTEGKFLTNCPDSPQTIRSDEDFTLTWLNRNFDTGVTGYVFPYAMKASVSLDGNPVGHTDYVATTANGGIWPNCSTLPPLATGASGPVNYLYSFKINPADITSITRDQEVLFGPGNFGCTAQSIPDVFPGYHDTGLTPAANPLIVVLPNDDAFITPQFNSNCTTGFGTGYTGSSELVYRNMQVKTGDQIAIQIPSEIIGTFTVSNSGGYNLYNITHTSTKNYTALGLRWFSATTVSCGKFGCFSNFWNITRAILPSEFDQICLALYPWANAGTCALGEDAMSEEICLTIDDTNCWGFEPIRFTWINPLGGRDWYTFIKRNTFVQQASRSTLYKLPGYWSAASYSVKDNQPARFGTTVFRNDLTNTWTASTDWLTEAQSAWLRDMFASPSVIAYLPGRTQPVAVVIQDAEYAVQTIRRENLFQYFVSFIESLPANTQSY
jgi:hypothetical protein